MNGNDILTLTETTMDVRGDSHLMGTLEVDDDSVFHSNVDIDGASVHRA